MIIPSAENIEAAVELLKTLDDGLRTDQLKELRSGMGAQEAEQLGVRRPPSKEFEAGYTLGLQTARQIVRGSTALMLKQIDPEDVL